MRIIAGKFRGRVLKSFNLPNTRPTTDLVRESLFNIINYKMEGCSFLDMFGGTGAISFEAESRGAKRVVCIEKNFKSFNLIKENAKSLNSNIELFCTDFNVALRKLSGQAFDIIFLDPPYKTDYAEECIDEILKMKLIKKNGILIWEHDEDKLKSNYLTELNAVTKKYGSKYLSLMYF